MDGPILKDWQYFTFWGFALACGVSYAVLTLRLLVDLRALLRDIRERLK